jgi:hypothetical protein
MIANHVCPTDPARLVNDRRHKAVTQLLLALDLEHVTTPKELSSKFYRCNPIKEGHERQKKTEESSANGEGQETATL